MSRDDHVDDRGDKYLRRRGDKYLIGCKIWHKHILEEIKFRAIKYKEEGKICHILIKKKYFLFCIHTCTQTTDKYKRFTKEPGICGPFP